MWFAKKEYLCVSQWTLRFSVHNPSLLLCLLVDQLARDMPVIRTPSSALNTDSDASGMPTRPPLSDTDRSGLMRVSLPLVNSVEDHKFISEEYSSLV